MEQHDEAAELLERASSLASVSGTGFDRLSEKQRRFAALYVLQAGNATKAAELAGYGSPDVAGHRTRLNPKVAELIQLLALADVKATLPVAISVLVEIATDKTQKAADRRKAALDLVRIAGGLPDAAPTVALQVNTGSASHDGAPSVVIQNVWTSRSARMSGIAAPMPDTMQPARLAQPDGAAGDGAGGCAIEGSRPA